MWRIAARMLAVLAGTGPLGHGSFEKRDRREVPRRPVGLATLGHRVGATRPADLEYVDGLMLVDDN